MWQYYLIDAEVPLMVLIMWKTHLNRFLHDYIYLPDLNYICNQPFTCESYNFECLFILLLLVSDCSCCWLFEDKINLNVLNLGLLMVIIRVIHVYLYACNRIFFYFNNYYKQMRPFLIKTYIDSLIWLMSNLAEIRGFNWICGSLFFAYLFASNKSFSLYTIFFAFVSANTLL